MNLVNFPETLEQLIKSQGIILLYFLISVFIIKILKLIFKWKKIRVLDVFPIFGIVLVQRASLTQAGTSLLPICMIIWMVIAITWVLRTYRKNGEVILKQFLFLFWRFSDLFWLFMYMFIITLEMLKRL
ncbi:DUF3397 family protein [Fructilactobacillus vespulae]|uniref:DUF3397 family protein n=1 Tax=Fructilactobacillus vespulae TaxID=1249630 RepID=UPI0039B5EC74